MHSFFCFVLKIEWSINITFSAILSGWETEKLNTCFLSREWRIWTLNLIFLEKCFHPVSPTQTHIEETWSRGCWTRDCGHRIVEQTSVQLSLGSLLFQGAFSHAVKRKIQIHAPSSTNNSIWVWGWPEEYIYCIFLTLHWYFIELLMTNVSNKNLSTILRLCHGKCWWWRHLRMTLMAQDHQILDVV